MSRASLPKALLLWLFLWSPAMACEDCVERSYGGRGGAEQPPATEVG